MACYNRGDMPASRTGSTDGRSTRSASYQLLKAWAPHLSFPGALSVLTERAAACGCAGRSTAEGLGTAADPEPLAQGAAVRSDIDLYAVGRGVGAAGERAGSSGHVHAFALAMALRVFGDALGRPAGSPERAVEDAARAVGEAMRKAATADPIFEQAGCAVTGLWLGAAHPVLIHAGDGLAVRLRARAAQALTVEHTLERDCREKGIPLPSPYVRAVLLRLFGAFDPGRGTPEMLTPDLAPEDRVLFVTADAATRLTMTDYAGVLEGTPAEAARKLVETALARKAPEAAVVAVDLA